MPARSARTICRLARDRSSKVHRSGIPFDDASGDRLREWLGVTRDEFYDPRQFAILPMGFCFPGTGRSGDLPPRPECAVTWREPLLRQLRHREITLVLGQYAQRYHFAEQGSSLTERVRSWRTYWPRMVPLPHPSPRNIAWLRRNPWFEADLVPALRNLIAEVLRADRAVSEQSLRPLPLRDHPGSPPGPARGVGACWPGENG